MKKKFAAALAQYFQSPQSYGLCSFMLKRGLLHPFYEYVRRWPLALKQKNYLNEYLLADYFIPASETDKSLDNAAKQYDSEQDKTQNSLRRDLANFILKELAREQKKKFVPID